jgi:hypothetical protein
MARSYRAQFEDLSSNKLDALVGQQDTRFSHAETVLNGK